MRSNKKSPPKLPFSEEQIRAKAYEIWQSRGGTGGSAEEDWKMAIQDLMVERRLTRRFGLGVQKTPETLIHQGFSPRR